VFDDGTHVNVPGQQQEFHEDGIGFVPHFLRLITSLEKEAFVTSKRFKRSIYLY
jgi:hypothetical protein